VRLGKTLAKIGLAVDGGAIVISNQATRRSISMMEQVQFRLPRTTNALESFHWHGNEETPRWNDFVPSVVRIATMMIRKTLLFETALQDSFRVMIILRGGAQNSQTQKFSRARSSNITQLLSTAIVMRHVTYQRYIKHRCHAVINILLDLQSLDVMISASSSVSKSHH
jgi:hypothetical protein